MSGITNKINEGKLYLLLQTALRMRRAQRSKGDFEAYHRVDEYEAEFDKLLDDFLKDVDLVNTDRVIRKMEEER